MELPLQPTIHIDLIEDSLADATLIRIGLIGHPAYQVQVRHFPHPFAFFESGATPPQPGASLVLTDFSMPFMNGLELLQKLRLSYGPNDWPVFITTGGLLTRDDLRACQAAGVAGIISKPTDPDLWQRILEEEMLPALGGM